MLELIATMREFFLTFGSLGLVVWTLIKILVVTLPLIISVAFYTLLERKVIGWMHVRQGPQFIGGIFGIGFLNVLVSFSLALFVAIGDDFHQWRNPGFKCEALEQTGTDAVYGADECFAEFVGSLGHARFEQAYPHALL